MRKPPIIYPVVIALALSLASSMSAAERLGVSGSISEPRGGGIARATVELLPLEATHQLAARQLEGEPWPEAVARTRTDRDGDFYLEAPPGFWRLIVRHPEFLPAVIDLSALFTPRSLARFEMQPRSELAARLVDSEGGPVAGARLRVAGWSARWKAATENGWWPLERVVDTDDDGLAALPCSSSETVSVAAVVSGHYLFQNTTCDAGLVELKLEAPRSVRLIDDDGSPIAGAFGAFRWPFLAFGVSDEEGWIAGPFAEPGAVPVTFADRLGPFGSGHWVAPLETSTEDIASEDITSEPDLDQPTLRFPPTVLVNGRAVDAVSGSAVEDVWLWVGRGSRQLQFLETGDFTVRVSVAPTTLSFGSPEYLTSVYRSSQAEAGALVAKLTPAQALAGRVIDPDGLGLEGVRITSWRSHLGHTPASASFRDGAFWQLDSVDTWTTGDGSFELRRLPPRRPFELRVSSPGFATQHVPVPGLDPAGTAEELVITLEPGIRGVGFVVTESEMPIAGAEVALLPSVTGAADDQSFEVKENYRTVTVGGGSFTLDDLPVGRFYLSARAVGFPELLVPGIEVTPDALVDVGDGAVAVDLGTVVLEPGVLVSGQVRDDEGEPVAGVQLSLRHAQGEQIVVQRAESLWFASSISRANGSFHIDSLPRDSQLILLASAEGFLPREMALTTGVEDQRLDVELSRGTRVRGVVLDPAGRPAAGARVQLLASPEMRLNTSTSRSVESDAEGRFEASGLMPGEYTLSARLDAAESEPLVRQIPISNEIYLELRQRSALAVTVTDTQGAPIRGAFVSLLAMDDHQRHRNDHWRTDTDGEALFQPLDPGAFHLKASHREYESEEATVEVEGVGEDPQLYALRLQPKEAEEEVSVEVSGRVLDPEGRPVLGSKISLDGPGAGPVAVSGAGGHFTLEASPGEYRLRCRHKRFAPYAGELFTVGSGGVSGLLVELSRGAVVTGRITGLEFEDLSRLVVTARGPFEGGASGLMSFGRRYGTVDFEGEFRIDGLSPGNWMVRAELLNPTRSASESVGVTGAGETRVDLHFVEGYRLTGRVLGPTGPIAGSTVRASCPGEFRGEAFTDGDGQFVIHHVPGGQCEIRATDLQSGLSDRQQLELSSDSDIMLEINPL